MKDYTRKLLDKALDAIEAAEGLMDMGEAEFSAGRAYYAMFYIPKPCSAKKDWNSNGTVMSLGRTVCILRRQKNLIQNIIAGL